VNLSVKTQYGIQALTELAQRYGGEETRIGEIARGQKIPVRFLEQILLLLKRHKLVYSARGKNGGYTLSKRPSEITIKEVVEALEGPLKFTEKKQPAEISELFSDLENRIKEYLEKITLDVLAAKKLRRAKALVYQI
jgi:Rrf2 family protein